MHQQCIECGGASTKRHKTKVKWEVIQTFPKVDAYNKWMEMKTPAEQVVRGPLQSIEDGDKHIFKCTYSKKKAGIPALTNC